jgi:uncharacterized protein (DUF58 family)
VSPPRPLRPPDAAASARPGGRLPAAGGPRIFILLIAGLALLGPAWWHPRAVAAMIAWDALVLAAWAWDLRRLPPPDRLVVRRAWSGPLALSTEVRVAIEVRNAGAMAARVRIVDDVPPALRREPPDLALRAPASGAGSASYVIEPSERGDQRVGPVFLRYGGPWRLAERWAVADLAQTVRVYPNLEESKRQVLHLVRSRQVALERRLSRQRGRGREFEGLREHRQGDSARDICWTASARRGRLVSKIFRVERSQAVWLVLDTGRLLRERIGRLSKLDHAVDAALGLAQVALHSGDRVGLLVYGRRPLRRLGAARGPAHLRLLVDELALPQPGAHEADHGRAAEALLAAQKQRALIVWLTDLAESATIPDVIQGAGRLTRRHLVLLVAIGQPDLAAVAGRRPRDVVEMYRYLAAQEMTHRRAVLLEGLRQTGALVAELAPAGLPAALVNRYLEIKTRGLI